MQVNDLVSPLVADNHKHASLVELDAILNQRSNPWVNLFLHRGVVRHKRMERRSRRRCSAGLLNGPVVAKQCTSRLDQSAG